MPDKRDKKNTDKKKDAVINTKKDKGAKERKLAGYAEELKKKGLYPLKPRAPWAKRDSKLRPGNKEKGRAVATPFLVVPDFTGDNGLFRPLNAIQAVNSSAIEVRSVHTNLAATCVNVNEEYSISCKVLNTGAAGCYSGIAEFYAADTNAVNAAVSGAGPKLKPLGYAGVIAGPGQSTVVKCKNTWKAGVVLSSVVVRVYDPLVDRATSLYDSVHDRHVGRKDMVVDFSGAWEGMESANIIHNAPTKIRIVITQTNSIANVAIYGEVGAPPTFPSTPQDSGTAQVVGDHFAFNNTEILGGLPFTSNVWTFNMTAQGKLHFTHHTHYMQPGDSRPDTDTNGTLDKV